MSPDLHPGVAFNAPPEHLIPDIQASIGKAVAALPTDAKGAIVALVTDKGVNAAFIFKAPHGFEVAAWIGKSWGEELTAGAEVMKVF